MRATTTKRKPKPKALLLPLADLCALSYAARILYTIPVCQWSNALDMVSMVEGKSCGRDGYILGQARAIWNAQSWPSEETYFASEAQMQFAEQHPEQGNNGTSRTRESVTEFWAKFVSENVAIVKKLDAESTAKYEAEQAKAKAKPDLKVVK